MQNLMFYKDTLFQNKIKFYCIKAAIAVMAEDASVVAHMQRVDFAHRILQNGPNLDQYALGILTNTTIKGHIDAGTSYDADLEFAVNSLFNAYAGVANITEVPQE